MSIRFVAISDAHADDLRSGGLDANGQLPERAVAEQSGRPCRHCLDMIEAGETYLTLALRPFPALQPYAEAGPVFLHAERCRNGTGERLPPFFDSPAYIVRGYDARDRIVYGTGKVVPTPDIAAYAAQLFETPAIRYAHVRSSTNNCYHCRIERA